MSHSPIFGSFLDTLRPDLMVVAWCASTTVHIVISRTLWTITWMAPQISESQYFSVPHRLWSALGFLISADQRQDSWVVLSSAEQYWAVLSSADQCWSVLSRVSTIKMDFNLLQDNCLFFFTQSSVLELENEMSQTSFQVVQRPEYVWAQHKLYQCRYKQGEELLRSTLSWEKQQCW